MNDIQSAFSELRLSEAVTHENLTMHRLVRGISFQKDYLTLDEALKQGLARVTEVSESGSVPQLLLRNQGEQAVFLLDGEELVGAKQNRVLNITILAPAKRDTIIPVSCVEAGRWHHNSPEFSSAPRAQFSEGRARKAARVTANLETWSMPRSDQSEVWDDINIKMSRMGSHSQTSAQEKMYQDHSGKLDDYVKAFGGLSGQVGGIFNVRGRLAGMEMFDNDETAEQLMPKIVRSYALDAIDPGYSGGSDSPHESPERFLERLGETAFSRHRSIGEGEDFRFEPALGIAGGALFARDRVVHLCAFAVQQGRHRGHGNGYRTPASARRPYRRAG